MANRFKPKPILKKHQVKPFLAKVLELGEEHPDIDRRTLQDTIYYYGLEYLRMKEIENNRRERESRKNG